MKTLQRFFCLLVIFASLFALQAQNVTLEEARTVAAAFGQNHQKNVTSCAKTVRQGNENLLYIFNSDNGFVVVSGDKRTLPILAFSDAQPYNDDEVIPPVKMWLDSYAAQIAELKTQACHEADIQPSWERLLNQRGTLRDGSSVAPLVQSHWGQGEPYNYYCPRDYAGKNGRCVTGCVATAIGQILYYFRFPTSGVGTYTYTHDTYGELSVNYETAVYDYSAMCDEPTTINPAISRLIADCGVGMDMVYGPEASGVYNHSAGRVLREHFKFSPETRSIFRDSTDMNWDSLVAAHLDRHIPLYYAGWSVPDIDGHGFVCDGYRTMDSSYYFHFNFGWNGEADGYFYTDALNVSGYHFNLLQEIVANAYPDTTLYEYPNTQQITGTTTFTSIAGSFTDGSLPHADYAANMNYTWIIAPEAEHFSSIRLNLDYEIAVGDTLLVTGGDNTRLITADSGSTVLLWSCDQITLHFTTDDDSALAGFRASYQTVLTPFCETYSYSNTATGHVEDGSGAEDYESLTYCTFKIKATGFPSVNLHFTEFDLEEGHDFLHVFYKTPTEANWLATYTGTMPDTTIFFVQRELYFVFETDEFTNAGGFAFDYEGTNSVSENNASSVAIYPNPTHGTVLVECQLPNTECRVYDVYGKLLVVNNITESTTAIDLSAFADGLYLVQLFSDGVKIASQKVVKNR
ncbi:MAG: C10 family peptidase [Bacteroidales bacterium]|nr:C10 family peptidase [Bacteroidales bacterium]